MKKHGKLTFLPLGGAGEIGMNLNVFGYNDQWIVVDCGISFADEFTPGVDVLMPDISFLHELKDKLLGIVLTHGHEDHIGALPYLWPHLKCPLYATPFTADLISEKLKQVHQSTHKLLHKIPLDHNWSLGPFEFQLVRLTHSIPEPNALLIKTPAGNVFHTGDWKFDPNPLIGEVADYAALTQIGEEGVLALIGDSTNALCDGHSGSESAVRDALCDLILQFENRIILGCFATNVTRLETIAYAAQQAGRHVVLLGRSLWRIYEIAKNNGLLTQFPPFLNDMEAKALAKSKVLYISTGSQGEPRAALARLAQNAHPGLKLEADDVVIFSSRIIPGNEKRILRLQNRLVNLGVQIITDNLESPIHVSGHPAKDELVKMYQYIRPQIAIPVHGELRHMVAHANTAKSCQVPHTLIVENGAVVSLATDEAPEITDHFFVDKWAVEGKRLIPISDDVFKERKRLMLSGHLVVTLVVKKGKLVGEPELLTTGVLSKEQDIEALKDLAYNIKKTVKHHLIDLEDNQPHLEQIIRQTIRKTLEDYGFPIRDKKPVIDIQIIEI